MNIIFIDNISFFSFFKILLKNYNSKEVKILSEEKKFSFIWIKLLGFFNFKVNYEKFFFGDIILKNNESIYLNSRKEASEKSFLYSKWILRNSDFLINKKISLEKKKILELYISKTVFMEMEHFIRRFEYLNYKYYNIKKKIILLPSPNLIEKKFIKQNFSNCHVFFYGFNINYIYNYLKLFIKNLIGLFNYCCSTKVINNKKSIVSIATDSIDLDSDLRHFPNWYTPSIKKLFIINFNHHKVKMSNDELLKNSIQLINNNKIIFSVFKKYHFKIHNNEEIPLSLLLEIKNFFYMTNGLFFLLKNLKCNRFIYSDPQDPITDSVQLFSSDLGIKTICLQYTNMAMKVPLLIPSSDIFLSFSNIYKKVFKWNDLGPKKIIPIGYAFKLKIIDNQFKIKENLRQRGVKIIITYFDESVQNEKWGLLNEDQNSRNMEIFARLVINNPKISVILKPQFCFNTIYKYNSVIVKKLY